MKKAVNLEGRFLELLKKHTWNEAVRLLKEERQQAAQLKGGAS